MLPLHSIGRAETVSPQQCVRHPGSAVLFSTTFDFLILFICGATEGNTMDEAHWERCPYYAEDECPHSSLVDRTYLIPHLLSSTEVEEVNRICEECGLYLSEKRKYFRLKRPFRVVVTTGTGEEKFRGRIANVSGVGALVTFKDWPNFLLDQKVEIAIYSRRKDSAELDETVTKVTGEVKRIDAKDKQAAVMFLEEVKPEFLLAP
jgi:hypothetical protein